MFPPWSDNRLMTLLLYRIGLPGYAMFLLLASGYWLLPLLISVWDGTVLNTQAIHRLAAVLESIGSPASAVAMIRELLFGLGAKPAISLPYLTDLTHFLFATVISCGAWLGTETLKNFDRAVKKLSADKVLRAGPAAVSRIYRHYRQLAFATRNIWLCVALAVFVAGFFVHLHFSANYAFWWGNRDHGAAGLVFAVMVGAMVFAVVWGSDILAYFVGRAVGGPKLMPRVSPSKTWSGAAGGTLASVVFGVLVAKLGGIGDLGAVALIALLLSVISQAGDLIESALKRHFHVKDSSGLLPGHGGLMDRLDGYLTAVVAAALIGLARGGFDAPARGLLVW